MKKERSPVLTGTTTKIKTECGTMFITINSQDGVPFEVIGRMGKSGGCLSSHIEAIGRLISCCLQHDIAPEEIVKQLHGIRCPQPSTNNGNVILSCADAFAVAMAEKFDLTVPIEKGECGECETKEN